MAEIISLVRQRDSAAEKITRIQNFLDSVTEATTVAEYKTRLEGLEAAWVKYQRFHDKIITTCDDEDVQLHEAAMAESETKYYNLKASLSTHISENNQFNSITEDGGNNTMVPTSSVYQSSDLSPPNGDATANSATNTFTPLNTSTIDANPAQAQVQRKTDSIKLPRVGLPAFSGNYLEWSTYHDMFSALIHKNQTLGDVQKLHYLKSSLSGEAANLLQAIEITESNYEEAWRLLNERYQNKRQLVQCHLKALMGQSPLHSESSQGIRRLLDTTVKHTRALSALQIPTDTWDAMLAFLVIERLDPESRREWELSSTGTDYPNFKDVQTYLERRCRALESGATSRNRLRQSATSIAQAGGRHPKALAAVVKTDNRPRSCPVCKQDHSVYSCSKFLQMNIGERTATAKRLKLCMNCLRGVHPTNQCFSKSRCRQCNEPHHTLLHSQDNVTVQETPSVLANHVDKPLRSMSQTLLSTAMVQIQGPSGAKTSCRALLDTGSQVSLVSEDLVCRLGIKRSRAKLPVIGIGKTSTSTRGLVTFHVSSNTSDFGINVSALILPKLTQYKSPKLSENVKSWAEQLNITLADTTDRPGEIELIIGADVFGDILLPGNIRGAAHMPSAYNTHLGWVLTGNVATSEIAKPSLTVNFAIVDLHEDLKKFWELEELPTNNKTLTIEEELCENHFRNTHKRLEDGRYCVRLPFRKDAPPLGLSRDKAASRLRIVEKKLQQDRELEEKYTSFMDEYLELGHMEAVPPAEQNKPPPNINYLPHHGVLKPDSTTTALRVVFDASSKTSSGASLNDRLCVGPKLQQDIWNVLLQFRAHPIAVTADITKMFRQILVDKEDAELQRILWRRSPSEPISEYRLTTVTYGTASAPFLASRTLRQLAMDEAGSFPLAASAVFNDFYVDDLISGADTIDGAKELIDQLEAMFQRGGFRLHKWGSNAKEALPVSTESPEGVSQVASFDDQLSVKTLGLRWNPSNDYFFFTVRDISTSKPTKRKILSEVARLYDPLGWLAPLVISAKILIQTLWTAGLSWDDPVPPTIEHQWNNIRHQLASVQHVKIPRFLGDAPDGYDLHGFSDASEQAYAAAVYVQASGEISLAKLLCSRTRVAPLKQISLPRLELCGAYLLATLLGKIQNLLGHRIRNVYAWTDSTICLSWIRRPPRTWKTFVANRVALIQEHVPPHNWRHVPSQQNPADVASRGITNLPIFDDQLWWFGPRWLSMGSEHWPVQPPAESTSQALLEQRKEKTCLIPVSCNLVTDSSVSAATSPAWDLMDKHSSLTKLKRVTAWCLRFINNCRASVEDRHRGPLTTSELDQALLHLVKVVQHQEFPELITALNNNKPTPHNFASLTPFLDQGIVRVGGRLRKSALPLNQRCPLLLPRQHRFTELVVESIHKQYLHSGPEATLAAVRRMFWIIRGRNFIRRILKNCHNCARDRGVTLQQQMGDLPDFRIQQARPFLKVGVDLAGPFYIKCHSGRGTRVNKNYFALFICLVTKAVHIEFVGDLSTGAFLSAFRRFSSRRGLCAEIISDNATTASLRTAAGNIKRPIVKLCPLPIN